jgi:uncharacterized protein YfaS (alpha-2-macroglobulin family)
MKILKITAVLTVLIVILQMRTNAQVKNYEADWKTVEDHIAKGLPASALEAVKKIYARAKTEKQEAQLVKAIVYMTQLQQENREENPVQRIKEIEKEIQGSKEPVTSLLSSYLAGIYQQYFAMNRYKLYNRTNTEDFKKEDVATWTIDDFHKKISALYLLSLNNKELLQKTKLAAFDPIIIKGNARSLRPTLYDLLAHQALQYFKNDERDITKPAYSFEINDPAALSPAATFAKINFATSDSLSLQQKALTVFQDLIHFHLNDTDPSALIDVDIERLQYVHSKMLLKTSSGSVSVMDGPKGLEGKELLYYNALQQLVSKYNNAPEVNQARFLLATIHQQRGSQYDPNGDTTYRYELVKAKELTDKILDQKKENEGWVNAYNLNKDLVQPYFLFQVERVNIPDAPFRMLVNFKNVNKLYWRIIPATPSLKAIVNNERGDNNYWDKLLAAKAQKTWKQPLPLNDDLQTHATEIKADGLPTGEYFIVASLNNDFSTTNNILAARLTYISNISFVNRNTDFFVLDRNSGQPLSTATVQVYKKAYDYKTSTYSKQKSEVYTTDKNGYFKLSNAAIKEQGGSNLLFEIKYANDKLFIEDEVYYYFNALNTQNEKKFKTSVFLFTDRSIYRPGQTLYFKGIAVNRRADMTEPSVQTAYKTTLTLADANNQKVTDLQVATNEYGSFNGKFVLPQTGLNGIYYLRTSDGSGNANVRMEEYKRPKFYVDFEKVKDAYKVNEDVKIIGFAKAYAGNNIDGAKVKYRVVREARFPYPWLFWRGYFPRSESMEITNGEIQTDNDGKFNISFKAIPDAKLDSKLDPVFDYRIYADVTDINGETRSNSEMVSAGYKSLLLTTSIPAKLATDSLNKLFIRTENMSGVFQKATIQVKVTRLNPEQRLLRPRYWEKPDQFVLSKEQYIQQFPNDIYNNEDDPKTWAKAATITEQSGPSDSTGIFALSSFKYQPGYYTIEISTKDKDGNHVKDVQYIELFDAKKPEPVYPQYLYSIAPRAVEPGDKATTQIATAASKVFLIQHIDRGTQSFSFHQLDKNSRNFDITATEQDRGGISNSYLFVKNNRIFQADHMIAVPWTNKQLDIEYSSFRDKTLPGAEEKWSVKISGHKKEKVAAELLASMYDASLDQFNPHQWNMPYIWSNNYSNYAWTGNTNFGHLQARMQNSLQWNRKSYIKQYDEFAFENELDGGIGRARLQKAGVINWNLKEKSSDQLELSAGWGYEKRQSVTGAVANISADAMVSAPAALEQESKQALPATTDNSGATVRTNFNETAFFFPDLKTDKDGNISFSFTMPEALTKWKFQALTHTKDLALGYSSKEIVTQKDLMVQPNPPRFLREGDKMEFSSKVVNLSGREITGIATLQLFDAATNEPMDGWFKNVVDKQYFTIGAGQSQAIQFPIEVPYQFNKALTWRIVAKANDGSVSDGEENMLPVLTNRMLVTESLTLHMRGSGTGNFRFDKLLSSGSSETLTNQALTVEYTSNPVWNAVQALPYMMQYPYECAEQTWNRYYANSLATVVANSSPKIKQVFEQWRTEDTAALLSNLQKNEELKSVLLEETPWVLAAKNEAQQKKNVAVLFDLMRMSGEQTKAYDKLRQLQSPNGGFVWFKGGADDRYMTQYIVTGIGHLKKLKAVSGLQEANLNRLVQAAIPYLDNKIKEEYEQLLKYKTNLKEYVPSYYVIQYLYMRSFFPQNKISEPALKAVNYFKERAKQTWTKQNKYMQGMIALSGHRDNDLVTPKSILKSLRETAIRNEEQGMYYKDAARSWWWYEAPVERQALLIEAFDEAGKDAATADDLRTWLLKNKQTNNWESTKATAEACYALLLRGTNWLSSTTDVSIDLGGTAISSQGNKTEAGTGYFKTIIEGSKVRPAMGNIALTVKQSDAGSTLPTWGSVYWQYFEDLDKITTAATPLQLSKKLFIEKNTATGPVLTPVNEGGQIKVGDKIKVRIELRVDRDMEYVHMKDMRASSFEPVNVLSQYKWQGGLGYYETTKDASTNFFFSYLRKGTYVFEYTLFAQLPGNYSNGITSIQCMYAPEFSSHTEGVRVNVEK